MNLLLKDASWTEVAKTPIISLNFLDSNFKRKGIGFSAIKNLVAGKFPALRVDLRVNILKNAIFRELRFGHIECVSKSNAVAVYKSVLSVCIWLAFSAF